MLARMETEYSKLKESTAEKDSSAREMEKKLINMGEVNGMWRAVLQMPIQTLCNHRKNTNSSLHGEKQSFGFSFALWD